VSGWNPCPSLPPSLPPSLGGCYTLRDMDDREEYRNTLRAMKTLGFGAETVEGILRLVACLLHLGQVGREGGEGGRGGEARGGAWEMI